MIKIGKSQRLNERWLLQFFVITCRSWDLSHRNSFR